MTTISDLEKNLKLPANLLLAKASTLGFTGSVSDELPEEIVDAIKNGGAKKLNAAPPQASEPTAQTGTNKGQGLNDIYSAFYQTTQNLQQQNFEVEKASAIATGRMLGHQLYMNMVGAKNETLQTLIDGDLTRNMENYQTLSGDYQSFIEEKRQKALSAWSQSDKKGKSVNQCLAEIKALNASFDI